MAQDDSPNRDVSELGVEDLQTFDELKRHMSIGMRAYTKRYRAAAAKDKAKVAKTRPNADIYHPLLSKLVTEGAAEEAEEVVTWWWHGNRGRKDAEQISQLLIDHHIQSDMLEKFVPRMGWNMEPEKAEPLFRRILEASNVKSVKATTSFSLLELLSTKAETAEGKAAELLQAEIKSLSQSIKTEYSKFTDLADVTFGDRMEAIEFVKQLAIGKPVPDIAGSDLKGVDFKLSDYEGKVVMISFWGGW